MVTSQILPVQKTKPGFLFCVRFFFGLFCFFFFNRRLDSLVEEGFLKEQKDFWKKKPNQPTKNPQTREVPTFLYFQPDVKNCSGLYWFWTEAKSKNSCKWVVDVEQW